MLEDDLFFLLRGFDGFETDDKVQVIDLRAAKASDLSRYLVPDLVEVEGIVCVLDEFPDIEADNIIDVPVPGVEAAYFAGIQDYFLLVNHYFLGFTL